MATKEELEKKMRRMETMIKSRDFRIKELIEELTELRKLKNDMESLTAEKSLLFTQQREFKKFAEEAGSKAAKYQHDFLRLEEKYNKLKVM